MFIVGSLLIKETAPVGTRIAKLVVTDRESAQLESDLKFNLISESVKGLPFLGRLPKRQVTFPGGLTIEVDDRGASETSSALDNDEEEDTDPGKLVDPVNRHFAVRAQFNFV